MYEANANKFGVDQMLEASSEQLSSDHSFTGTSGVFILAL